MTRAGVSLILVVLCLYPALAFPDERDRESLRDLDGVRVKIEEIPAILEAKGLSRKQLGKTVESKLDHAAIRVMNSGEFPVGDPFLDVKVTATQETAKLIGYNVEVKFIQIVFLRRNPALTFNLAETWRANGSMKLVPSTQVGEEIRRELSEQVDQFISAYRSVNPK